MVQLLARGGCFPAPTGGRTVNHTEQRADWELSAGLQPRIELRPRPSVHADLAALAALPAPDEYGAAGSVEITLEERQRFAYP
jgi:hypothetical protein